MVKSGDHIVRAKKVLDLVALYITPRCTYAHVTV